MKTYFFDTESIGLFSPTVLIQYSITDTLSVSDSEIIIHNLWTEPVGESLKLIKDMCNSNVVGFNLAHDWFHISRTYGVLSLLPKNKPPSIMDYHDCEDENEAHDKYCLKPQSALDLMLYGRTHELQATMNQKDIVIRRVPRLLAEILIKELEEKVIIPKLYFAKRKGKQNWKIRELHQNTSHEITPEEKSSISDPSLSIKIDPDFVNLRLSFFPSTGLKPIAKYLLGYENIDLIENMLSFKRAIEYSWFPSSGAWLDVAQEHIQGWSKDKRRLKYAKDDVVYTKALFEYFKKNNKTLNGNDTFNGDTFNDYNSMLACMAGSLHWRGFTIDLPQVTHQAEICQEIVNTCSQEINFNSPRQVLTYLREKAEPLEKMMINDTTKNTLESLLKNGSPEVVRRTQLIFDGRHASKKLDLLNKLIRARRLYVTWKITGTKSNRMAGGSMEDSSNIGLATTKGGSINPQGIKKGSDIRNVFTLAFKNMALDGGDFDGYEVSIADAVYKDDNLRIDLLSGKSIHALWGSFLYKKSYEEVIRTKDIAATEPEGFYSRSKNSFFAKLYDAQTPKIAQVTNLSEEEVYKATQEFEKKYPGIKRARDEIYNNFEAMSQPDGIGTAIRWKDPKEYSETFLGFRRYFSLEFAIIKALYDLAQNPTKEMKQVGHLIKVKRRDRMQSGSGALQSAIYSAAFTLQSAIMRAANNNEIQSPGGEMTKILEARIWEVQPKGINRWIVMPFNVHDELEIPVKNNNCAYYQEKVKEIVYHFIKEYRKYVPLLSMTWKQNLNSWGDK